MDSFLPLDRQLRPSPGIERDPVLIDQPVQGAPDFAAEHPPGPLPRRQGAQHLETAENDGDVRVMLVGRIVHRGG